MRSLPYHCFLPHIDATARLCFCYLHYNNALHKQTQTIFTTRSQLCFQKIKLRYLNNKALFHTYCYEKHDVFCASTRNLLWKIFPCLIFIVIVQNLRVWNGTEEWLRHWQTQGNFFVAAAFVVANSFSALSEDCNLWNIYARCNLEDTIKITWCVYL